jgi:hypothetical protein
MLSNNHLTKKSIIHRREFLNTTCLAALGAIALPSQMSFKTIKKSHPANIALQLYTVRNEISKDIAGTLGRVAEAVKVRAIPGLLNHAGLQAHHTVALTGSAGLP